MFNVGWFTASAGLFRRDEPWDKMIRFPVPADLVETETERILVIGADVAHFASGFDDHRFPMIGDDHEAQGRSAERLRELRDAGSRVLPGHDPDVLVAGALEL